jgi:hypothetical protein
MGVDKATVFSRRGRPFQRVLMGKVVDVTDISHRNVKHVTVRLAGSKDRLRMQLPSEEAEKLSKKNVDIRVNYDTITPSRRR